MKSAKTSIILVLALAIFSLCPELGKAAGGNTFYGTGAGSATTGSYNSFFGQQAGNKNTTGYGNTFSGYKTGYFNINGNSNTFSGYQAGCYNTAGYGDTFSGYQAGYKNTTGARNTFSGFMAGYSNTTGSYNSATGSYALYRNTTGIQNTAMGYAAGYNNKTGSGNVFLGHRAGLNETGSDKLYIANSDATPPLIYGDFSTGNVGIGTTSPGTNKLEVSGGPIKATGGLIIETRTSDPPSPATGRMWLRTDL